MTEKNQFTFLLVESDLTILDFFSSMLLEAGHQYVLMAEDGSEAWSMFKNFNVDFVISNLEIPEINGLALLRIIRAKEEFSATPYVLVVKAATPKLVFQAGRAGVSDILIWPVQTEVFRKRLNQILNSHLEPKNKEAEKSFKRGMEMMEDGKNEEALQAFEGVLSVHEHAEIHFNMGYINASKGLLEEALGNFRRATEINNQHAMAYQKMAEIYRRMGDRENAEQSYHLAGDIYMERKQDNEAEEIFQILTDLNPDTTNVYNSLGIIYRRSGRLQEAVTIYQKAMKVDPGNENIYFNLSRVFLDLKNIAKAKEMVKKSLDIKPTFPPARELAKALELGITFNL